MNFLEQLVKALALYMIAISNIIVNIVPDEIWKSQPPEILP